MHAHPHTEEASVVAIKCATVLRFLYILHTLTHILNNDIQVFINI